MTLNERQETARSPLEALFTSSTRAGLLRVFMLDPTRAYYQRQLEAATGFPLRAVQRELDRLTAMGLLFRRPEGNRTYYHTDTAHLLFPELRGLVMKCAPPIERLRGALALNEDVLLALLHENGARVLVVFQAGKRAALEPPEGVTLDVVSEDDFRGALTHAPESLEPYLALGTDLLGRRDNLVWRHIEAAGFTVARGAGVP